MPVGFLPVHQQAKLELYVYFYVLEVNNEWSESHHNQFHFWQWRFSSPQRVVLYNVMAVLLQNIRSIILQSHSFLNK